MTNQDRQSAAFPRWESAVHPRRRGNLAAAHRGERWGDGRYLAAYRRLLARHQRLIRRRRHRIGDRRRPPGARLRRAVVAAFQRPDPARRLHPLAGLRHRGEFRQSRTRRSRRHPDRAHREWRRRGAGARYRGARSRRHRGRERAEGGNPRLRLESVQRPYARRKPQSGRRRNGGAHRAGRQRYRLCFRRRQASDRDGQRAGSPPSSPRQAVKQDKNETKGLAPATPAASFASAAICDCRVRRPTALPRCCRGSTASAKSGLDGHDLRELGLKDGTLTVDDAAHRQALDF